MIIHLCIIDPQNDFCITSNANGKSGTLAIPGADQDMIRLAAMINRLQDKIDDIHVTLDSHRFVDISHPCWWRDASGNMPTPFTLLTMDGDNIVKMEPNGSNPPKITDEEFTTYLPSYLPRTKEYLKALVQGGRYPHCIWPEHCLIGSWGHNVVDELMESLWLWEKQFAMVNYITKGSNPWTEHFSGVKAEVPDPEDPLSQLNADFINVLGTADMIAIAGQARSHCLANTVKDIADTFSNQEYVKKLVLLTDATSNVPGFEQYGESFIKEMTQRGMQLSTTVDFLS